MINKRRHPRVRHATPVMVTVRSASFPEEVQGEVVATATANISTEGVQLRLPEKVERDAWVDLRLTVDPPLAAILLKGHVAWVREIEPSKVWVAGLDISSSDATHLQAWRVFVKARLPAEAPASSTRSAGRDTGAMW